MQQAGAVDSDLPRRRAGPEGMPVPVQEPTVELHVVEEEH